MNYYGYSGYFFYAGPSETLEEIVALASSWGLGSETLEAEANTGSLFRLFDFFGTG